MSFGEVEANLRWKRERAEHVMEHLIREGMAWIDDQTPEKQRWFWFPAFFQSERKI